MPPHGGIFNWVKYGRTSINFILDSNGGRMGRITSFSKQVIVFFLVTALIIRPTFAATVGGWSLGPGIAQGASTVYEGTKKVIIDGKDYIKKGTVKVTPTATNVAKVLARSAGGLALSVAVEQILGAVDWVLDPANNQIVYKVPNELNPKKLWQSSGVPKTNAPTAAASCTLYGKLLASNNSSYKNLKHIVVNGVNYCAANNGEGYRFDMTQVANPNFDEANKDETKTLPLEVVANKVISNAESGVTSAQSVTGSAAADIVAEAQKDNVKARPITQQLESSASTKPANEAAAAEANTATGTQTQNPTKPEATDLKLEFPAFCGWAPIVCEAAQTVISFPQTLTNWWETGKSKAEDWATSISEAWTKVKEEYANKPEENTDTKLDIEIPEQEIDTEINFGGSCPAPLSSDINFMGLNKTIEFSFDPVCQIAEFIKPVVISISAFSAALIVAGIRTEDD